MIDPLVLQAAIRFACTFLPVLLIAAIKVTILLGFAFAASRLMRGTGPNLRHALWLAAMGGSLFIFVLSLYGPLFHIARPSAGTGGALAVVSSDLFSTSRPLDTSGSMPGLAGELWRGASSGRPWVDAWPVVVLLLWIAGALSGWLNILWGRLQLLVVKRIPPKEGEPYGPLVRGLSRRLGIVTAVQIVESPRCTTPLTVGVFRPVIVLPTSMRSWSASARRSVLLHELHHVRSGDSALLAIAYAICSLFWFVPLVWTAYARLYLEQEKACDEEVVDNGVKPHAYATCIVDAAQFSREPALPAGLSFAGRTKRVLRDRIMAIIRRGKRVKHGGPLLAAAAFMLAVLAVMSASGLDAPREHAKKYGSLYLGEYRAKTADEASIISTLRGYEAAFNSHDLPKLVSFFARDALYHPCGVSAKYPIADRHCQDMITYNFGLLKFERYFDPRISVDGRQAVVKLLIETGDYLADYVFVMNKQDSGWRVLSADYSNVRWKGYS